MMFLLRALLLRRFLLRRLGPFGIALTAYDIWRRIPLRHRRRLIDHGRKNGTRIVQRGTGQLRRRRPPTNVS